MKTYRIGIVGCGGISSQRADDSPLFGSNPWSHAKAYAEIPECQVVAVSNIVKKLRLMPERQLRQLKSCLVCWNRNVVETLKSNYHLKGHKED